MRIKKKKTAWKTKDGLREAAKGDRCSVARLLRRVPGETERLLANNDQWLFYKYLKGTVGLGGRNAKTEQCIRDEDGPLLRDNVRILERGARFFGTLLTTKSSKFDPTISALFLQRPLAPLLGDEPTMDDMTAVFRGMPDWKAVRPDSLPAELQNIDHPEFTRYFHGLLGNVGKTGNAPQQWKYATIKVLHKKKDRSDCNKIPRDFACCPFRQSSAENGRVPPK